MEFDSKVLVQGIGTGIVMIVLVHSTFERFAARLRIETATATTLSLFASVYACTLAHLHFFGNQPFGNLITPPVLLALLLICFFFAAILPSTGQEFPPGLQGINPHLPGSAVAVRSLKAYIQGSVGWSVRAGLVAMLVAVLRSGSQG
jgi:hypothetical protein